MQHLITQAITKVALKLHLIMLLDLLLRWWVWVLSVLSFCLIAFSRGAFIRGIIFIFILSLIMFLSMLFAYLLTCHINFCIFLQFYKFCKFLQIFCSYLNLNAMPMHYSSLKFSIVTSIFTIFICLQNIDYFFWFSMSVRSWT